MECHSCGSNKHDIVLERVANQKWHWLALLASFTFLASFLSSLPPAPSFCFLSCHFFFPEWLLDALSIALMHFKTCWVHYIIFDVHAVNVQYAMRCKGRLVFRKLSVLYWSTTVLTFWNPNGLGVGVLELLVADSKPKKVTWQFQPLATGHFMLLQNPHPWLVHPPVWSFPRRDSQWQVQQWFPNYRQRWLFWKATNLRPSRKMLPKDTAFNWWWWLWRGLINGFKRHHAYKAVLEWKKIDPWIKSHLYESNNRNRSGSSQPFDLTKSKITERGI